MDCESKGSSCSFLCRNQNIYVGNPILMKTPSWQVTAEIHSAVFRISHTISLFVLPSCQFLLWKSRKISSGGASPDTFLPPFPALVLSPDFTHSFISLYQHLTCDLVHTFKVSNSLFPSSLSFQFSLFTQGFGLENIFSAG